MHDFHGSAISPGHRVPSPGSTPERPRCRERSPRCPTGEDALCRSSYMKCVTMPDVNEGLLANMIADGDDLRRIYETLTVLSKKIDVIFEMMNVEQEQRL